MTSSQNRLFSLALLCVLLLPALLAPMHAQAWGMRGHQTVCEAAIHLVRNETLKSFLKSKGPMMAHLCNAPDTYWKSLGESASSGGPTHFIDPEVIGLPIREIPLNYQQLQEQFEGKPDQFKTDRKIFSVAKELGSLWWRADQFVRRATEAGKLAAASAPPANRREEQSNDLPFNRAAYDMIVNMGLLGHFVGDGGQPFHSTADYDGYSQGHGGIHAFYEGDMVSQQDEKLLSDVVARAKKLLAEAKKGKKTKKSTRTTKKNKFKAKMPEGQYLLVSSVLEKMRALSALSADDISPLLQKDPIVRKSVIRYENGMELKTAAVRRSGSAATKALRPYVVKHLARSAALLAQMWDGIYEASGRPKIDQYRSYRFAFQPDFIGPDYLAPVKVAK